MGLRHPVSGCLVPCTTDRGDQTWNSYECQNFQQVFTGVPVHIKQVFMGDPRISNEFSRE